MLGPRSVDRKKQMGFDLLGLFGVRFPIIGMAHLPPLPGTPLYDEHAGPGGILDAVRHDITALCAAGVDGIMFCNEGDRPYELSIGPEGVAMMTRVVTELAPTDRPYGVDLLWDAQAALGVAAVTGASWIREVATGVYESDMGLWAPDVASLLRQRRNLAAQHVAVLMNVTPEFASTIGSRDVGKTARSVMVSSLADAVLVSGPMAGAQPDLTAVQAAKEACGAEVPVIANTGVNAANVEQFFDVADAAIVGSGLKVGGHTWNPVDQDRATGFMQRVRQLREVAG